MRITHVGTVAVPVADQQRALEFYVGTLGFEQRRDLPFGGRARWIEVAPRGAQTTVALVGPGVPLGVRFMTNDAEAAHAELRARGVDTDADITRIPSVPAMFSFRDPDGTGFVIVDQPGQAAEPGDVPAERPTALDRLEALVGEWRVAATFGAGFFGPDSPAVTDDTGRTSFAWFAGRFFLVQRATVEHPAAPSGLMIVGPGTQPETFVQHYYDSRGVHRTYQMSLGGGTWKLWRSAPGFSQRFTATFSGDGDTITGAWEKSADGIAWEHDFDMIYTRISRTSPETP